MTLLELTVVILVLLVLVGILFFGAQAWKRGSDRTACILNIRNVQQGVRSFSNLYGYSPGSSATNLKNQIIGVGRFVESTPMCPGNGVYGYGEATGEDTIPPIGTLYLTCSLEAAEEHVPKDHADW